MSASLGARPLDRIVATPDQQVVSGTVAALAIQVLALTGVGERAARARRVDALIEDLDPVGLRESSEEGEPGLTVSS